MGKARLAFIVLLLAEVGLGFGQVLPNPLPENDTPAHNKALADKQYPSARVCGEKIIGVGEGEDGGVVISDDCWACANCVANAPQIKAKERPHLNTDNRVRKTVSAQSRRILLVLSAFVEIDQVGNGRYIVTIRNSMLLLRLL